jgi:hypothetical protein
VAAGSGSADAQALMGKLVPYPAGAQAWTKNLTGTFSLDGFLGLFFAPTAKAHEHALMVDRGFAGAVRRGWIAADGTQEEVWLVDFSAPSGASSLYLGLTNEWKQSPPAGSTSYPDPAVHGMGMSNTTLDAMGNSTVKEMAVVGRTFVYVRSFVPATPNKANAQALIKQQVGLLGGN